MTERERRLATILMVILVGIGVLMLVNTVYFTPVGKIDKQLTDKQGQINTRLSEIKAEREYMARIKELSPRLGQWRKLSLPEGDPSSEGFKSHLNQVQIQYQKVLEGLLAK